MKSDDANFTRVLERSELVDRGTIARCVRDYLALSPNLRKEAETFGDYLLIQSVITLGIRDAIIEALANCAPGPSSAAPTQSQDPASRSRSNTIDSIDKSTQREEPAQRQGEPPTRHSHSGPLGSLLRLIPGDRQTNRSGCPSLAQHSGFLREGHRSRHSVS